MMESILCTYVCIYCHNIMTKGDNVCDEIYYLIDRFKDLLSPKLSLEYFMFILLSYLKL